MFLWMYPAATIHGCHIYRLVGLFQKQPSNDATSTVLHKMSLFGLDYEHCFSSSTLFFFHYIVQNVLWLISVYFYTIHPGFPILAADEGIVSYAIASVLLMECCSNGGWWYLHPTSVEVVGDVTNCCFCFFFIVLTMLLPSALPRLFCVCCSVHQLFLSCSGHSKLSYSLFE